MRLLVRLVLGFVTPVAFAPRLASFVLTTLIVSPTLHLSVMLLMVARTPALMATPLPFGKLG